MKSLRDTGAGLLLIGCGGLLGLLLATRLGWGDPGTTTIRSAGPTIEQIQEMSDLIVLRVQVADVLMAEHSHGAEMALLVRGDCDLTIDLAQARVEITDPAARAAVIRLPQPAALRPRVDHERTRVYEVRRTGWWTWRDPRQDLYAQGMAQAQQLVAQWAGQAEQIERARRHAEQLIRTFYRELDWTVAVEWLAPPDADPGTDPGAPPRIAARP